MFCFVVLLLLQTNHSDTKTVKMYNKFLSLQIATLTLASWARAHWSYHSQKGKLDHSVKKIILTDLLFRTLALKKIYRRLSFR